LNLLTYCNKNVVKEGKMTESCYPFRCSLTIDDCIIGGELERLAMVARTCVSGDTSDTIDDAASKLRIVSIILFDSWLIKIILALSCRPKMAGSS
jgi:hypothetical protein